MRLLYITPYIPNVLRTRPYYLLKTLAGRHEITLLAPYFNQEEFEDSRRLKAEMPGLEVVAVPADKRQAITQSLKALSRREPMQAYYCYSPELLARCRELVASGNYDLVHVEHFRMAFLGQVLAAFETPLVFDAVDSISLLVERTLKYGPLKNRLVSAVEIGPTRRYEAQLLRSGAFQAACATSAEDARALEKLAGLGLGQLPVEVIPNGVDLDYFSPLPADPNGNSDGSQRQPETVVFSGKMSYHANIAAARYLVKEIWPLIRQARPQARLQLVGSRPPADLQKLNGQQGLEVTGYVTDMRAYLRQAAVCVAPMVYSVGIQNKVLEAMACATPVVATGDIYRGIEAENGRDLFLVGADQPAEFAHRVIDLLEDPAKAAEMGRNGRARVVKDYSWEKAARLVEELWLKARAAKLAAAGPAMRLVGRGQDKSPAKW